MKDIKTILLKAREDVYTNLNGTNISKILGEGYDFVELQEYQPNSDIKHISWIHSAKLGEIYTKKMIEEKQLNIVVCTMIDGRFIIEPKIDILSYTVALLGYSCFYFNNSFSYIQFCGEELSTLLPTKDSEIIKKTLEEINRCKVLKKAISPLDIPQKLMEIIPKKSLLFLIGDFLDDIDLSTLSQKHEIIVIIIRSKWEEEPIASPNSQLINPQTGKPLNQTLTKRAIEHYKKKLQEHDNRLIKHFNQYNIRYTKIYNIDEVVEKITNI